MKETIQLLKQQFETELSTCTASEEIEALRIAYLGKKGRAQDLLKGLKDVAPSEKPQIGKLVNDLKLFLEESLQQTSEKLALAEQNNRLSNETIDCSLPGRRKSIGSKHPVTHVIDEMIEIFVSMGFSVQYAPEIESEYYNFDVLNMGPDHSARDMQDTFYVSPEMVLRTHCSNIQGRIMAHTNPPVRVICPGRCFRNESISSRHHVFFHQIDGLYIDEGVNLQDLNATLSTFVRRLFKKEVNVRVRPSYFPFVEPGIEMDIGCLNCEGVGCTLCKHSGWLEILGAGMVHPQVLLNIGLDPEKYTGFAWGLGVERIVLLRYGINDIRLFSENDMRFLEQFPAL